MKSFSLAFLLVFIMAIGGECGVKFCPVDCITFTNNLLKETKIRALCTVKSNSLTIQSEHRTVAYRKAVIQDTPINTVTTIGNTSTNQPNTDILVTTTITTKTTDLKSPTAQVNKTTIGSHTSNQTTLSPYFLISKLFQNLSQDTVSVDRLSLNSHDAISTSTKDKLQVTSNRHEIIDLASTKTTNTTSLFIETPAVSSLGAYSSNDTLPTGKAQVSSFPESSNSSIGISSLKTSEYASATTSDAIFADITTTSVIDTSSTKLTTANENEVRRDTFSSSKMTATVENYPNHVTMQDISDMTSNRSFIDGKSNVTPFYTNAPLATKTRTDNSSSNTASGKILSTYSQIDTNSSDLNASTIQREMVESGTNEVIAGITTGGALTNSPTSFESTTSLSSSENTSTVDSTTPVTSTEIATIADSTTPVKSTDITTTVDSTTPVKSTYITTTVDSTTPVKNTNITTTVDSTTPVKSTDITTTVDSTTPVKSTYITTTVDSTTPVKSTNITTTVDSTTPVKSTDITTTVDSTTPVKSTDITTTVDSTTPAVKTSTAANMSMNTSSLDTTYITRATTPKIATTRRVTLPITTVKLDAAYLLNELTTQYSSGIYDSTTMQEILSPITVSTSITTTAFSSTTPAIKWQQVDVILLLPQSWSSKLLEKSSEEYTTLEKDIKTNVNTSLNYTASDVTITEFRPGSIIAEITVNTSQSKSIDILKAAVKKGEVGKLRVDKSFPVQPNASVIVTIEHRNYVKVEGDKLSVQCTAKSGTKFPTGVKIMWMLNGQPIKQNNKTGSRVQVTQNITNKAPIGKLTFKKLSLRDTGNIQCLAAGSVKSNSVYISLSVTPLPKVTITTNTPYIEEGQNVTMSCSIVNNVTANITFYKTKGSFGGNTTKYSNGQLTITLFGVTVESNILCRATNPQGKGEAIFTVSVYPAKKKTCPKEDKWPITPAGETTEILCASGFTGDITRRCTDDGIWEQQVDKLCVREEFKEIERMIEDIKDNIGGDTTSALIKLANVTDEKREDEVSVGELLASIDVLEDVVNITENQENIKDTEIDGFFSVANNIITPSEEKWSALKEQKENIGITLLKRLEKFGSIVANKVSENTTTTISKNNLAAVVSKVSIEETNSFPGKTENLDEWVKESKTTMDLTSNVLGELSKGTEDSLAISVVLFRNISNILSDSNNKKSANETKPTTRLNTMVISITVGNDKTPVQLENPIKLSFQHINKLENTKSLCSYWVFAENNFTDGGWSQQGCEVASSNISTTQCNCYHLTNFAVLTTLVPQNSKALSIITYVGCSISIFCCLLTIILYIIFWENMAKSELGKSKAGLMINMCVAVILSYTLLVAGIKTATVNKDACTTVAAFLHFFCLSLFFSILIYAVDMAVTIFSVFPTDFNRLPFMLTISWLFPAIIVGITLGVTNTEGYGNDDFCWLSVNKRVIWAFIGPIIFVIVVNTVILAYLFRTSISSTTIKNKSNRDKIRSGAKSLLVITPIFGITWIIGIFAVNEDTIVFQYAFAIINSLQGLFIFLAFCVFDKQFRQAMTSKYNRFVDLRSTDRTITFLNKSKRTQLSQLSQLRERSSNYENVAFEQSEEPVPDYVNAENILGDDGSENVSFEFEALPITPQELSRRHFDDSVGGSNMRADERAFWQEVPNFKGPIIFAGHRSSSDALYSPYYQRQFNM